MQPAPHFVILYVDHPGRSADFYAGLLGSRPIESSPNFAMFALSGNLMLGLWAKHAVQPAHAGAAGATELGFPVESDEAVLEKHQAWAARGLPILQTPVQMDFAFTFVAADPDGHRLRVFGPSSS